MGAEHLGATRPLPDWFWTGDTELRCLGHAIRRALATGYSHHIERLMVICNFCHAADTEIEVDQG